MKVKLLKKVRKYFGISVYKHDPYGKIYYVQDLTCYSDYSRDYRVLGKYETLKEAENKKRKLILAHVREHYYKPKRLKI